MKKKFFFFDIDGTLAAGPIGHQYIPESTSYALKQLEANGHFVAIATGRAQAMAVPVMHKFGLKNMVSDGGSGLTIDDKLVELKPLDRQACIDLIDELIEKDIAWGINPDNGTVRLIPSARFQEETQDEYMESRIVPGLNPRDYENFYKVYIAGPPPLEDGLVNLKRLPWVRYGNQYIFCEPVDKPAGIHRVIEIFDGDLSDVVVFGDGPNDLSMFCPEWTSIAMGNAIPELKEKATYVTTDVDKDGIYNACRHFGWI